MSSSPTASRLTPFGSYYFRVEIQGENISYPFKSVAGLKSESAVVELEEGGFNGTTRKLIGRTKWPNIVLKRGFCGATSELYRLRQKICNDLPSGATSTTPNRVTPNRFNGTITQIGPNGVECKWTFANAWVCKWEGPDLDASKNEIAIESIEIAHEGLVMHPGANPGGSSSNNNSGGASGGDEGTETEQEGGG
jgi:phage tail-like protein